MAPILVKIFVSPKGSSAWQYIVIVLTYSITMAARPIGSAIFGRYADRIGRRFLLVMTIAGVGVMSLLGGLSQRTRRWASAHTSSFARFAFAWGSSSVTNTRSVTHLQSDTLPRRSAVRLAGSFSRASRWDTSPRL